MNKHESDNWSFLKKLNKYCSSSTTIVSNNLKIFNYKMIILKKMVLIEFEYCIYNVNCTI